MVEPTIEALIIAAANASEHPHTDTHLPLDPEPDRSELASSKLHDALVPGFEPEFTPHEAEAAGAFLEDALREEDAREADLDSARLQPAVLPQKA